MSARKFLALALASCLTKQYEEAGIFLAQASVEVDAEDVARELGDLDKLQEATSSETDNADDLSTDVGDGSDDTDHEWGEEDEEESEEGDESSISSGARRKVTSMHKIGRIIAATISVSSDDEADEEADEDEGSDEEGEPEFEEEVDPDFDGELLVPASLSSVRIK